MKTVLIVEDEKMIRKGIRSMIQRSGVPVDSIIECNNGQLALDILREQKIDVMFTDIRMPKMDGIELVERMQELPDIPLTVVISGYDDFSYAVKMMRNGVSEYILKPVDREQIASVMKKMNDELERKNRMKRRIKDFERQSIRYWMLNEEYARETNPAEESGTPAFWTEYVVCCMEKTKELREEERAVFLGEVQAHTVVIAEAGHLDCLLNDELRKNHVGVSAVHKEKRELAAAYREAAQARREAFCTGSSVCRYSKKADDSEAQIEQGLMEQIAQMIGTDRLEDGLHRLTRIVSGVKQGTISMKEFENGMLILIDSACSTYQNVLREETDTLAEFRKLYMWPDLEHYILELTEWMIRFHEKIQTQYDDYRNKQKMQQAVRYIKENYAGDLNMAVVSNHVSMNYSLFSYEFKQFTGKNFVSYLKELRIKEAKRLLAETDLYINEISLKVGYDNEKHFMKTFKSLCGVSPTEYRKNMLYQK